MNTKRIMSLWEGWQVLPLQPEDEKKGIYKISKTVSGEEIFRNVRVISVPSATGSTAFEEKTAENDLDSYFEETVSNLVSILSENQRLGSNEQLLSVIDYKILPKENEKGFDVFIMCEYLPSLETYLQNNKLTETQIMKLGIDISKALEACHSENLCHGDLTVENIFVSSGEKFKLGNIGINAFLSGRKFEKDYAVNTDYAAPEVVKDGVFTPLSDIYSLGAVLLRATNGSAPFVPSKKELTAFDKNNALRQKIDGQEIPLPQCKNKTLSFAITHSCEYVPEKRFPSAHALTAVLSECLESITPEKPQKETSPIIPIFINGEFVFAKNIGDSEDSEKTTDIDDFLQKQKEEAKVINQDTSSYGAKATSSKVVHASNTSYEFESKYSEETLPESPKKNKKLFSVIIIAIIAITLVTALYGIIKSMSKDDKESEGEFSEENSDKSTSLSDTNMSNSPSSTEPDMESNVTEDTLVGEGSIVPGTSLSEDDKNQGETTPNEGTGNAGETTQSQPNDTSGETLPSEGDAGSAGDDSVSSTPSQGAGEGSASSTPSQGVGEGSASSTPSQGAGEGSASSTPSQGAGEGSASSTPSQGASEGSASSTPSQGAGEGSASSTPSQGAGQGSASSTPSQGAGDTVVSPSVGTN